ncbi:MULTISPECIES: hypothetical protein [unclassified Streptomyces]|uniref:hypothetical protein n=1 Tax=unclassified Streptomyces TaxID=2593676 RepID=UPI003818161E
MEKPRPRGRGRRRTPRDRGLRFRRRRRRQASRRPGRPLHTDKACTLYHYPYVGFGAAIDGPIDAMGSAPKAIATIGPKEKACAGLFLYRGSERTIAVEAVSIGYQDRALNSNEESSMLDVALSKENRIPQCGDQCPGHLLEPRSPRGRGLPVQAGKQLTCILRA